MKESCAILFAQRLNDLSSRLSELEDLRLRVEEAERRARAGHRLQSPPKIAASRGGHLTCKRPGFART